ncbi:hypothetical protein P9112_000233 [Eukaryota sp. TZLM1-RC]
MSSPRYTSPTYASSSSPFTDTCTQFIQKAFSPLPGYSLRSVRDSDFIPNIYVDEPVVSRELSSRCCSRLDDPHASYTDLPCVRESLTFNEIRETAIHLKPKLEKKCDQFVGINIDSNHSTLSIVVSNYTSINHLEEFIEFLFSLISAPISINSIFVSLRPVSSDWNVVCRKSVLTTRRFTFKVYETIE